MQTLKWLKILSLSFFFTKVIKLEWENWSEHQKVRVSVIGNREKKWMVFTISPKYPILKKVNNIDASAPSFSKVFPSRISSGRTRSANLCFLRNRFLRIHLLSLANQLVSDNDEKVVVIYKIRNSGFLWLVVDSDRVINEAPMIRTTCYIDGNRGDFWIWPVKPHPPANRTAPCSMSLASNRMMNLPASFR